MFEYILEKAGASSSASGGGEGMDFGLGEFAEICE